MESYRIDGLRLRHRVGRERTRAVVVTGASGYGARIDIEATTAAAVRAAREIVPADVLRQRDVVIRGRADPSRCQLLPPRLGSTKVFDDLRAAVAGFAAIEDTLRRQTAGVIGELVPPQGTFTARFVKLHHEVRLREAEVQADSARRND